MTAEDLVHRLLELRAEAEADMARVSHRPGVAADWLYLFAWGQAYACERALAHILPEQRTRDEPKT